MRPCIQCPFAVVLVFAPTVAAQDCEHNWAQGFAFDRIESLVWTLGVHDDGSGPGLYAGGIFTEIAGEPVNRVARLDPSGWSPLGTGVNLTVPFISFRV